MFQGNVKGVSKKFKRCFKKFSRVFQESLRVYCNFVVAWHSSQLPDKKEGLFRLAEQCHTQDFYLRCFKSDFDAVKSTFVLLIM